MLLNVVSVRACGLAAAIAILLCGSAARAQTPYYFDVNTTTGTGFGTPTLSGTYNVTDPCWTTNPSGGSAGLTAFPNTQQMVFGVAGSDLANSAFTINMNGNQWSGVQINGASANVTLIGANYDYLQDTPETWYVAQGSTLTEAQTDNGYGLNFNGAVVSLSGGGTINWKAALGYNGGLLTQNGPVVNLEPAAGAVGYVGGNGYLLASGTLNFANANAFGALPASGNGKFTISDSNGLGVIDNTSGFSGTLSNIAGGISIGGNFTFIGSNPLNFGAAAVALANTSASVTTITVNSNTLTIGGPITGTNTLAMAGSGTLVLSSPYNTYSGGTIINGGTLALGNPLALQNSVLDASGAGTFSFGAFASATLAGLANTGGSLALNNATGGATLFVGNNNVSSTYSGTLSGSGGLTKIGAGALTLTGSNTYAGLTTVNAGALALNFAAAGAPATNVISDSSTLALAGGSLALTGSAGATNSQAFNGLNLTAGANQITLNANGAASLALSLGAIVRNPGGTVNFTLPAGTQSASNGVTTSTPNTATTILGGWATVNGTDWAANNGTNIVALGTYTQTTTAVSYNNADVDVNSSPTMGGSITPNSLRFNTLAAETLNLTGTNAVASGGILVTSNVGNNASIITGGTLQGASGADLSVIQNNTGNSLAINSVIADNGAATGLTLSGPGTLTLGGSNTFTGGVFINSGLLQMGNNGALGGGGGNLTLTGGTLDLHGNSAAVGALSGNLGALIQNTAGGSPTLTIDTAGSTTFAGAIQQNIGLVQNGSGVLILSGTSNSYNGATTINGGTLQVGSGGATGSLGNASYGVVDNAALVYSQSSVTVNNAISGSGSVSNVGAAGALTINKNIAMTGTGGFAFNSAGLSIASGLNLSVVDGVGTINSVSPANISYNFPSTGTLAANGAGSINISFQSNCSGGAGALQLGGGTLVTSGNVNLSGSGGGGYGTQDQSSNTSITALSGTTTISGDSATGTPVFFAYGNTVALSASPGAAIVWKGGANSGTGLSIFRCFSNPRTQPGTVFNTRRSGVVRIRIHGHDERLLDLQRDGRLARLQRGRRRRVDAGRRRFEHEQFAQRLLQRRVGDHRRLRLGHDGRQHGDQRRLADLQHRRGRFADRGEFGRHQRRGGPRRRTAPAR